MRLPSLNALRAFEAAAKHESFARAADALCVTEGAVSRHVKLLEEEIGVPLFRRLTRKVELTDAGRDLLPVISSAFQSMSDGILRVREQSSKLKVVCGPSLSIRWLLPRLERFRALNPDCDITVNTTIYSWDEFHESYDVALCCGDDVPMPLMPENMLPCLLSPVCSPRVAEKLKGKPVAALSSMEIVHSTVDYLDWRVWNTHCAGGSLNIQRGQAFQTLDMALKAVMFGDGVLIGDITLMQEELASGAVVLPFPQLIASHPRYDYYVVFRPSDADHSRIKAFRNWVKTEAAEAGVAAEASPQNA